MHSLFCVDVLDGPMDNCGVLYIDCFGIITKFYEKLSWAVYLFKQLKIMCLKDLSTNAYFQWMFSVFIVDM